MFLISQKTLSCTKEDSNGKTTMNLTQTNFMWAIKYIKAKKYDLV